VCQPGFYFVQPASPLTTTPPLKFSTSVRLSPVLPVSEDKLYDSGCWHTCAVPQLNSCPPSGIHSQSAVVPYPSSFVEIRVTSKFGVWDLQEEKCLCFPFQSYERHESPWDQTIRRTLRKRTRTNNTISSRRLAPVNALRHNVPSALIRLVDQSDCPRANKYC
jgi:hypothetical protein